ncbi:hypothetical protein CW745_01280 [Psychromonas sp. psych-6C06]|uniref:hypothetical protein n=1 Tax=Psychromonas sp. psych-6C06 TaxID=2058089 RepID=UPI000C32695E|nr:hypothetical protein [Psychromonas sp. psych-6C06]PKF63512.1 hypothetical protein CW745_01280 [Psychromonas sp. psych-6C06]
MNTLRLKLALISAIILTLLFTTYTQAEDSMLTKKPYFTYRIEAKGALYQAKINGILLEEDFEGHALNFEQVVNQYMRTGRNRVGFELYTYTPEEFEAAKITISLYVNQDEAPESQKKMISQVTFKASDFAIKKNPEQAIQASMPAVKLDSTNEFLAAENGDVLVHPPKIEPSKIEPTAYHIYQDIELVTPFPEWGFFKADILDFPTLWSAFTDNVEHYDKTLLNSLYKEHEKLFTLLKTEDFDKILPLFVERNKEYDIALYYPEGTYDEMLKKAFKSDFDDKNYVLKLHNTEYAQPAISDDKKLIRIGSPQMIYFENEEHSLFSKYPIWFYKKDGKWIISR